MENQQNASKQPTVEDYQQAIKNQIANVKQDIGTLAVSLDGVKNQVKPIMQSMMGLDQVVEQYAIKIRAEFTNEINALRKEFEDYKQKVLNGNIEELKREHKKSGNANSHAMDDPNKKK